MDRKVLVTGSGGFVGRALVPALETQGHLVCEVSRTARPGTVAMGDIDGSTDWRRVLEGCDGVVHLAARVHRTDEDAAASFRINRDATLRLAEQAAESGVRRFVFMSTIKVNGEGRAQPYREGDVPAPEGPYAMSKLEAERGLAEIAARTGLETVVLRPPLVYGPGVGGNFRALFKLVAAGLPLPLGAVRNRRSLIGLGNLVSVVMTALEHASAPGGTFLLSDQDDVSTPELIRAIASALGQPARLLPVPTGLLSGLAGLAGRQRAFSQLAGSLAVDSSPLTEKLGWRPARSMEEELAATAAWFKAERQR